jgi:hypothetical protein
MPKTETAHKQSVRDIISVRTQDETRKLLKLLDKLQTDEGTQEIDSALLGLRTSVEELYSFGLPDTLIQQLADVSEAIHGYIEGVCIAQDIPEGE